MKKPNLQQLEKDLLRTSFPIELRCVSMLQKNDWSVRNNFIFEDPEQQKHREIDIFACDAPSIFDEKSCMTVYLLVECKKSDYAWIFYPSSSKIDQIILGLHDMIWRDGESRRTNDESDKLVNDLRWDSRFNSSRIFSWFFEKEGQQHRIHDAISKLAKATYYVTVGEREDSTLMNPPLLYVIYQAIVLDGLMCSASTRGKKIHLSPINHLVLGTTFVCPSFRTHMLIDVVQAEYFSKYIKILEAERDKYVSTANNFYHELQKRPR